jgi:hypothetical protein
VLIRGGQTGDTDAALPVAAPPGNRALCEPLPEIIGEIRQISGFNWRTFSLPNASRSTIVDSQPRPGFGSKGISISE